MKYRGRTLQDNGKEKAKSRQANVKARDAKIDRENRGRGRRFVSNVSVRKNTWSVGSPDRSFTRLADSNGNAKHRSQN